MERTGSDFSPMFDEVFINKTPRTGANTFGIPVSREVANFYADVSQDAKTQMLINMFFAGKMADFDGDL